MARNSNWSENWAGDIGCFVKERLSAAFANRHEAISKYRQLLSKSTGRELSDSTFRDWCTEALEWMIVHASQSTQEGLQGTFDRVAAFTPFVAELLDMFRGGDEELPAIGDCLADSAGSPSEPLTLYERYLAARNPSKRLQRGVFYTPPVIARCIVERIDTNLREQFGLTFGLADTTTWREMLNRHPTMHLPCGTSEDEPFVRVLDPAAGTGIFLIEVVGRVLRTMRSAWEKEGLCEDELQDRWNAYVPQHLLPRLHAVELMATPNAISQIEVANALAGTGYAFDADQRLRFSIADALLDPRVVASFGDEELTLRETLSRTAFTVVLGNPPFRGISNNPSSWISKLLRGEGPGGERVGSYYEADGKALGERKLWLQDDYVKFMRFAQWQIERAGVGLVGLVTNHGYLDNTTFRGMRHSMLQTFQQIEVCDLQGNRKKNKRAPDGSADEGMFDIEQGVAMGVFARTGANEGTYVTHREVWGSREVKASAISNFERMPKTQIFPVSPHYRFVPNASKYYQEYEAGFRLNEMMPVNSTAVVTARDSFVIDFDERPLAERMDVFCNLSVSDDEIRQRYFTNSRSTKYPPGDTRGWKLAEARRRMAHETDLARFFHSCLYRPFDRRTIFWADWMIDWPRHEVTRHLVDRQNMALVARRQMPPTGDCSFFWITDSITLDGVVRSDNRGSESIFPLWLDSDTESNEVNLSVPFINAIKERLGLAWNPNLTSASDGAFGPVDVLHYIYALFNSPTYRQRYSDNLRSDFPRVLIPQSGNLWNSFCRLGQQLVQLHLMKGASAHESSVESEATTRLDAGYPVYTDGEIWLGPKGPVVNASERVWKYQVGAHQVCRKWLRDRRAFNGRSVEQYREIVSMVAMTLELTDSLDLVVADTGGWEAAFVA
ncbi:MAG: hypothetical protein H6822_13960 [Planctomycetaceae bacterium]|nr:hypothetical protein [Planctomycetales bacterium]MCB9923283.1 hypothetical protein [Planctomycetaceae bacterium]